MPLIADATRPRDDSIGVASIVDHPATSIYRYDARVVGTFTKNNVAANRLKSAAIYKVNDTSVVANTSAVCDRASAFTLRAIGIVSDEHHAARPSAFVSDGTHLTACVRLTAFATRQRIAFDRCVVNTGHLRLPVPDINAQGL
ncbi:hypothetical protein [Paraburkholderia sp. HD33-4]|uniref:hypothetical protein n=1 Tax=Paraburkholderia sp. HD33-4 TaxID=2883242 RepID=UPI001F46FF52|nr:hypothetical protein [Paraburkholderia sp. HD33-4]